MDVPDAHNDLFFRLVAQGKVRRPRRRRGAVSRASSRGRTSVLLLGKAGTGKTYLTRALVGSSIVVRRTTHVTAGDDAPCWTTARLHAWAGDHELTARCGDCLLRPRRASPQRACSSWTRCRWSR